MTEQVTHEGSSAISDRSIDTQVDLSGPEDQTGPRNRSGEAAAALLACGVGSAVFGVLVVLAEANPTVKSALTLSSAVGPLSGKAVASVAIWLLVWLALHRSIGRREVVLVPYLKLTRVLIVLSFVLTFPPVFFAFH